MAATRAPSGRGLWEVRKGRRQRGYYKVSSSFPRRADEECWGTPAPGFRSYQYGTLSGIGYAGFVWSATIPTGSGYAHHLYFDYSWLNPQSGSHRSYGLQLRCLQE